MTETIFSWPGLGALHVRSALSLGPAAIMGMRLVFAIVYLLINLLVDLSYALVDPAC
jgi:peptide/nickel transport system permease protein